ncbi:MAG: DUF4157 domain-containing protein [Cyclobacteriaceae bacterium]
MPTYTEPARENKTQTVQKAYPPGKSAGKSDTHWVDNRRETSANREMQLMADKRSQVSQLKAFQKMADKALRPNPALPAQRYEQNQGNAGQKKENDTGLPDALKSGIESLSGFTMDDVKVHYQSEKPGQLQAHAYAQGTDIHLAPGQEKHLPHEAWHVVQQKQGRVKPTFQLKGKVNINDDAGLEKEADWMGRKAATVQAFKKSGAVLRSGAPTEKAAILQGLFLPNAKKDIAEDRGTLIREYFAAEKEGRNEDMVAIKNKQRETPQKPPALIPMGWDQDAQFESEVGLYGTALEMLEQNIKGKPGWRLGMKLFEFSDMYFAEDFVNALDFSKNPAVPLKFLLKMKEMGALSIEAMAYRKASTGANGMKYYFAVTGTRMEIAEWHVHWEAKNKPGSPGWKKGKNGEKTPTGDEMRDLLGQYWGTVKSTGGYQVIG